MLIKLFSLFIVQCHDAQKYTEEDAINYRINELSNLILQTSNHSTNFVISPLNVFSAFKVLQRSTSGVAHDEIEAAFGHENEKFFQDSINYFDKKLCEIAMINRVFYKDSDSSVLDNNLEDNAEVFDFKNKSVNPFYINNIIEQETQGKIKDMFPEALDPETTFLVISTLFFKSSWATLFFSSDVCWRKGDAPCNPREAFTSTDTFDSFYGTRMGQTFRIVEVPLTLQNAPIEIMDTKLVFQIWLPNRILFTKNDHKAFLEMMEGELSSKEALGMRPARLDLTIPKLSISTELDLRTTLKQHNIVSIFVPGFHLGPIYGEKDIRSTLGEAKHKVKFDVDEKGIDAAAVTALSMMSRSYATRVKIDRPFYFRLILKTKNPFALKNGAEIFSGRVVDP